MKLLVTGGSGLLGSNILRLANKDFECFGTYNTNPLTINDCKFYKLDITNKNDVNSLFQKINPEVVIHTSSLTNVDYCEKNREETWKVNVEGTRNIVDVSKNLNCKLVFISTDFVFDGIKGMYTEIDKPNPLNYYGLTKLEGEKLVRALNDYLIIRTTRLYGRVEKGQKRNFAIWVIESLKNKQTISVITDQICSPTLANVCADVIIKLIKKSDIGFFNVAGKGCVSVFDFAKSIANVFELDDSYINPVTTKKSNQVAKRPMKNCLDVTKVEKELNIKIPTIVESLKIMKQEMVE